MKQSTLFAATPHRATVVKPKLANQSFVAEQQRRKAQAEADEKARKKTKLAHTKWAAEESAHRARQKTELVVLRDARKRAIACGRENFLPVVNHGSDLDVFERELCRPFPWYGYAAPGGKDYKDSLRSAGGVLQTSDLKDVEDAKKTNVNVNTGACLVGGDVLIDPQIVKKNERLPPLVCMHAEHFESCKHCRDNVRFQVWTAKDWLTARALLHTRAWVPIDTPRNLWTLYLFEVLAVYREHGDAIERFPNPRIFNWPKSSEASKVDITSVTDPTDPTDPTDSTAPASLPTLTAYLLDNLYGPTRCDDGGGGDATVALVQHASAQLPLNRQASRDQASAHLYDPIARQRDELCAQRQSAAREILQAHGVSALEVALLDALDVELGPAENRTPLLRVADYLRHVAHDDACTDAAKENANDLRCGAIDWTTARQRVHDAAHPRPSPSNDAPWRRPLSNQLADASTNA
jgi:hypothetical protein